MPVKTTITNSQSIFGFKSEEARDKSMDIVRKSVVRPEKPYKLDLEVFTYLIEKMIEDNKVRSKYYSDELFGMGFINFVSDIKNTEYALFQILFPDHIEDLIRDFVDKGYYEYWDNNYFENKYGKLEGDSCGYIIQPDDYENSVKIKTIEELYNYIYNN